MKFYLLALRCLFGWRGRARTPVRWLCLRAFDYLARCHRGPLRGDQLTLLGQALELGVFLNRYYDGKAVLCRRTYLRLRRPLPEAETLIYLRALRQAERLRPAAASPAACDYRRRVSQLSLDFLARLVELPMPPVVLTLVTQIQLLDDLLDRNLDRELGLPTMLSSGDFDAAHHARLLRRELWECRQECERPLVACGHLLDLFICLLARLRCRSS